MIPLPKTIVSAAGGAMPAAGHTTSRRSILAALAAVPAIPPSCLNHHRNSAPPRAGLFVGALAKWAALSNLRPQGGSDRHNCREAAMSSFYDHPRAGRPAWRKYAFALAFGLATVLAAEIQRFWL